MQTKRQNDLLNHAVTLYTSAGVVHVVEVEGLPPVGGFVLPVSPSSFTMVLNAETEEEQKKRTFLHEITHVLKGHHSGSVPVPVAEHEAEQAAAALVRLYDAEDPPDREELNLLRSWLQQRTEHCPFHYEVIQ